MEVIYRGTVYTVPVISPIELYGARLYNVATKKIINSSLTLDSSDENIYKYTLKIEHNETLIAPQGIYNLELYRIDGKGDAVVEACHEGYAKLKDTSFIIVNA
jgi:hypothetical protein